MFKYTNRTALNMVNFWRIVNEVIKKSDMILLVLDARHINETRNIEIENKILRSKKTVLYVINKCDLADIKTIEKNTANIKPSVYISAKDHLGTSLLRQNIMKVSSHLKLDTITIGVLGYPNVGKSSIINALKGKASAKVSNVSGYTKSRQNVRVSSKIILIDTPGVIPYKEKEMDKHMMIGTINAAHVKDPDLLVITLMKNNPGIIEKAYDVSKRKNPELTLETIAKKKGLLMKGGIADIDKISRIIIQNIQKGKINI